MNIPGYYLTYDNKIVGPIAPDNPAHEFTDPNVLFKCRTWIAIMKKDYDIEYDVESVD